MTLGDLGSSIGNFFSNLGAGAHNDLNNAGQAVRSLPQQFQAIPQASAPVFKTLYNITQSPAVQPMTRGIIPSPAEFQRSPLAALFQGHPQQFIPQLQAGLNRTLQGYAANPTPLILGFTGGDTAEAGLRGAPNLTKFEAKKVASNLGLQGKEPTIPTGEKPLGVVDTVNNSPQTSAGLNMKGSYNVLSNKQTLAAAQQRIASDPNGAYQFALNNHNAEANATAVQLAKQYEAAGQPQMAANLMIEKAKQALEAGQGNQVYSLWDKLSPETVAKTAQSTIDRYNSTAKQQIPALTAEQYQKFVNQAKTIQGLSGKAKDMATQQLLTNIGRLIPSSGLDKATSIWRTGLLTGFRTPGKILVSHAVSNTAEQLKNIPAKGVDMAASLFTGQRSLTPTLKGNIGGFRQGISAAVDNFVHGYNAPNSGGMVKDFTNQTNFGNSLFGKVAQKYVDQIGRLHGSLYKPFFGAAHLNSLYDQAITAARNQGLGGSKMETFVKDFVANPPAQAADRAIKEAEYTTFQNKTVLGQFAGGLHNIKNPAGRAAGTVIAPFTQIPSSIAMKLVDYSPAGAVKTIIQNIGKGNFDQRAFSQGLGRSITGTGIMAIGNALYNQGLMTLSYPTDKNEQALWKAQGKTADSVLWGGKWRSLASLGPTGDALAVGGNFGAGMQGNKKTVGGVGNAAISAGAAGLSTIGNSPYLQDVNSLAQTLIDPARSAQKFAQNMVGSIVPTGIANIATATDPLARQTNNIGDSVTNKIPGVRQQNLPQYDVFGQNVPRSNTPMGSLTDPFYSSINRPTPILNELQRLQDSGNGVALQPLTKDQTIYGQKVQLNPQQLTQAMQTMGPQVQQALTSIMSDPAYQQLDDKQKATILSNVATGIKGSDYQLNQITSPNQSFQPGQFPGSVPQKTPPPLPGAPLSQLATYPSGGASQTPNQLLSQPQISPLPTGQQSQSAIQSSLSGNTTSPVDKYQLQMAKDQLTNSSNTSTDLGNGVYLIKDPTTGTISQVDIRKPLTAPTMTGNSALDKLAVSKYNSSVSTRASAIYNLYQAGQLTQDQAAKQLTDLGNKKIGTAKIKKVAMPKIKAAALPKLNLKTSKPKAPSLKLPKMPTLKTTKATAYKPLKFNNSLGNKNVLLA